jgi:hypothetical protein
MKSSLITNHKDFGGDFGKQFFKDLSLSNGFQVATGYFGHDLITNSEEVLVSLGKNGSCKLLLGMAFQKSPAEKQLDAIKSLDTKLRENNPDNGVYIRTKNYHGKIYRFSYEDNYKIFIGSSNFSSTGLSKNTECNIEVDNEATKNDVNSFMDFLFHDKNTYTFSEVELYLRQRKKNKPPNSNIIEGLESCLIDSNEYPHNKKHIGISKIKIRADEQSSSSFNLCKSIGRKNKMGVYKPRPWNEVEIASNEDDRKNEFYPKSVLKHPGGITPEGKPQLAKEGHFTAFAKDNGKYYRIKMRVHSDNGKNISSTDDREILGELIKGKLERANVLTVPEVITSETLYQYGRDTIELIKISDNEYIIDF